MNEKFGTDMYNRKYESKEETTPRKVVTYFVDKYLKPGMNCLDLGSGAGRHSRYMAEKGINVTAVDLSEVGIDKTKETLKDFSESRALIGDIHSLPFENRNFDSLVCNRVLDYNDDASLEIAFAEISRVMRAESFTLITVRSTSQPPKSDEILMTENANGGKSFKIENSEQIQHYFTESEIRSLADKYGFKVIEIREELKVNNDSEPKAEWQVVMEKVS